jgi:DNA modification methylase
MIDAFGIGDRFRLIVDAAEDVDLATECLAGVCDFAFTSPPYFSVERYSDDAKQSFKRYDTPAKWRDGFLLPLLRQHFTALKPGAFNVINIDDVRVPKFGVVPLVHWTKDAATAAGFEFVGNERSLGLGSADAGQGEENVSDEPVMVFRKPEARADV